MPKPVAETIGAQREVPEFAALSFVGGALALTVVLDKVAVRASEGSQGHAIAPRPATAACSRGSPTGFGEGACAGPDDGATFALVTEGPGCTQCQCWEGSSFDWRSPAFLRRLPFYFGH